MQIGIYSGPCPCARDCPDRHVDENSTCKSTCLAYINWKQNRIDLHRKVLAAKSTDAGIRNHIKESVKASEKNRHISSTLKLRRP